MYINGLRYLIKLEKEDHHKENSAGNEGMRWEKSKDSNAGMGWEKFEDCTNDEYQHNLVNIAGCHGFKKTGLRKMPSVASTGSTT